LDSIGNKVTVTFASDFLEKTIGSDCQLLLATMSIELQAVDSLKQHPAFMALHHLQKDKKESIE
jgi:hypothetical protein